MVANQNSKDKMHRFTAYLSQEDWVKLSDIAVFTKTPSNKVFSLLINRSYAGLKASFMLKKLEKELFANPSEGLNDIN